MALEERRFYYLTDLICAEDDCPRARVQVLAIVRRNLGEGTVSDLLQNVIDHFAHLEFTKSRPCRTRAHAYDPSPISSKLLHEVPVGDRQATLEMLLEPKEERDWNLHHLAVPYASKALLIIERNPKEMARTSILFAIAHRHRAQLVGEESSASVHPRSSWKDRASLIRCPSCVLPESRSSRRSESRREEHLPTVAELLRDQRVVAPGNQSIAWTVSSRTGAT